MEKLYNFIHFHRRLNSCREDVYLRTTNIVVENYGFHIIIPQAHH